MSRSFTDPLRLAKAAGSEYSHKTQEVPNFNFFDVPKFKNIWQKNLN